MSRRDLIALTVDERRIYVASAPTIVLSTHDRHGYPHSVAMWFVVDPDDTIWMTTYRKSQKTLNIRRNPKVALLVESGATYETLKGVLIRGEAEALEDIETVLRTIQRIHQKMADSLLEGVDDAMRAQARKRVAIRVTPTRFSSWDHSKLGGAY